MDELLESGRRGFVSLFVNEFVIKEVRWTLKQLGFSQEKINYSVDHLLVCCTVRKNISRVNFSRFIIRDKNDIPILAGSVNELAVLVTEDALLKIDSQKYIETVSPSEALKKLRSARNKKEG